MSNENDVCMHGETMGEFCQECKNLMEAANLDREYRNGFRAGWNAAMNSDEELLKQVNNRHKPR
ncbi:hypothetical protein A3715_31750 [Oleiphilus sp. HI0009]|nr:hypothetical protein A3715_10375 [Oleiphilus sp. HI0009]KZX83605.1 hypothetical protein A3715_31750 [Oleiphilus sp. HI0009]